jgi:general secretion pathway protein J
VRGYFKVAQRRDGFTLIEVVIAVAIFAVIGAMLFPAIVQFIDIRERVIAKHDQIENLQKTFLFMSKDLRFASNRLGKDEYGDLGDATLSVGDDSLIEMTSVYPNLSLDGLSVPRKVKWVLDDGKLLRLQYPVMDPDGDTRMYKQVLLDGVEDVDIELSVVEDGRNSSSKRWDEETRLPDLLTVVIKMEQGAEYQRLFTMLGADTLEAVAAAANSSVRPNPGDGDQAGGQQGGEQGNLAPEGQRTNQPPAERNGQ